MKKEPIYVAPRNIGPSNRLTLALGPRPCDVVTKLIRAFTTMDWRLEPRRIDMAIDDDGRNTYVMVWPGDGDSASFIADSWQQAGLYPMLATDQNGVEYVWARMG